MATARGVVTITDVTDGLPTISIIQSNENHTFSATSDGVVSAGDRNNFFNDIIVLIGETQAAYKPNPPLPGEDTNNTYKIGTVLISPSGGVTATITLETVTQISGTGTIDIARLKISAINNTTAVQNVTINVPVIVRRFNKDVFLNIQTTISKAVGGSAASLELTGTRQTFLFSDSAATSPIPTVGPLNSDIVLTAIYDGPVSTNIVWKVSTDGGSYNTFTPTNRGANTSSHILKATDFANASYVTYEVSKGTVTDKFSIVRLDRGDDSYIISARVSSGSLTLKNNTGSVTIYADVFKGGEEITSYAGWVFTWYNGTTAIAGPSIPSPTGITPGPAGVRYITVNATYVTDNGSTTLNILGSN